jgi:hypothetical protein
MRNMLFENELRTKQNTEENSLDLLPVQILPAISIA